MNIKQLKNQVHFFIKSEIVIIFESVLTTSKLRAYNRYIISECGVEMYHLVIGDRITYHTVPVLHRTDIFLEDISRVGGREEE